MDDPSPRVTSQVIEVVCRVAGLAREDLDLDTDLRAEHGVDSLMALQVVAALEKRFDVELPDEDLDAYTTVRAIAGAIERLVGGVQGSDPTT